MTERVLDTGLVVDVPERTHAQATFEEFIQGIRTGELLNVMVEIVGEPAANQNIQPQEG